MRRARRRLLLRHALWFATAGAALALGLPGSEATAPPPVGIVAGCGCGVALFVLLARRRPRLPRGRRSAMHSAQLSLRAAHEEALWRGALLTPLAPLLGRTTAAFTATAAFALAHVPSQGARASTHVLTGGAFSVLALGPGLLAAMAAHAAYNTLVRTAAEPSPHRPFRTVSVGRSPAYARSTPMTASPVQQSGRALLRLEDVVRRFGSVVAVDGVTLEIDPGEIVALLGPNGAGKSTAISIAVGVRRPDSGRASLFGGDPRSARSRSRLGFAPQEASFPPTVRVRELVDLVRSHFAEPEDTQRLLAEFGLSGVPRRMAGGLSGGERRRLALALAFAGRPRLLVLDEPSAGLDVETRRAAWDSIRAFRGSNGSVLLTTHHLEEAESLANRIVVLDRGRITASGTPRELRARAGLARITLRAEHLPELAGLSRVEHRDGRYVLLTDQPETVLAAIVASGVTFDELEVVAPSLEDAFLALTGRTGTDRTP